MLALCPPTGGSLETIVLSNEKRSMERVLTHNGIVLPQAFESNLEGKDMSWDGGWNTAPQENHVVNLKYPFSQVLGNGTRNLSSLQGTKGERNKCRLFNSTHKLNAGHITMNWVSRVSRDTTSTKNHLLNSTPLLRLSCPTGIALPPFHLPQLTPKQSHSPTPSAPAHPRPSACSSGSVASTSR